MAKMIIGLFENTRVAREALSYLSQNEYTEEDITVCIHNHNANSAMQGVVIAPALPYLLVDYPRNSPAKLLERLIVARSLPALGGNLLIAGRLAASVPASTTLKSGDCEGCEEWLARVGSDPAKTPYYAYGLKQGQFIMMIRVRRGDEDAVRDMLQFWGRGLEICEEKQAIRQPFLKQRPRRSTTTAL